MLGMRRENIKRGLTRQDKVLRPLQLYGRADQLLVNLKQSLRRHEVGLASRCQYQAGSMMGIIPQLDGLGIHSTFWNTEGQRPFGSVAPACGKNLILKARKNTPVQESSPKPVGFN